MRTIKHHDDDDGSEIKWNYVLTFIHSNIFLIFLLFLCKTNWWGWRWRKKDTKKKRQRKEIVTSVVNDGFCHRENYYNSERIVCSKWRSKSNSFRSKKIFINCCVYGEREKKNSFKMSSRKGSKKCWMNSLCQFNEKWVNQK